MRLAARDILAMAAWFGLSAGWFEVGTRILARTIDPTHRLNMMSRHYVWTVPLSNLLLFSAVGLLLALGDGGLPQGRVMAQHRILCCAAAMPMLLVASPQIYPWAWLILASGVAMRAAPAVERAMFRWRRWLKWSFLALLIAVPLVGAAGGRRGIV